MQFVAYTINLVPGYGLEERENPADFMLDIVNDSLSAVGKSLSLFHTSHPTPSLLIPSHPHTSHPHTLMPHTSHLTCRLVLIPHTAYPHTLNISHPNVHPHFLTTYTVTLSYTQLPTQPPRGDLFVK